MTSSRANRLVVISGWAMVAIALLHTVAHVFHPFWREWLTGGLWTGDVNYESYAFFWALPGSFVVVLAVLGLLVRQMGRLGQAVPGYVGWALGLWVVGCIALIGPSGFILGILPSVLLIVADLRRPSSDKAVPRSSAESRS